MNKAVIFDLDGTIYFGNSLADGAKEVLEELKQKGYEVLFFTNNSTKTRDEVLQKLSALGIKSDENRIYTSAYATAKYLQEVGLRKIFLIGNESFQQELQSCEIELTDELSCEAVVVGLDLYFNYEKIAKGFLALQNGAKLIATNVDKHFPVENGVLKPGSNAIVASLLGCSEKNVDYIVGKPNTYLLDMIVKEWYLDRDQIWVVGDSEESDIAMANNYGCKSVLVVNTHISLRDALKMIQGAQI